MARRSSVAPDLELQAPTRAFQGRRKATRGRKRELGAGSVCTPAAPESTAHHGPPRQYQRWADLHAWHRYCARRDGVAAVFAHAVHVGATKQVSSGNNIVTVLTLKLLLKKG